MNNEEIKKKEEIESALAAIAVGDFLETSKELLAVLGYRSERTAKLPGTADDFIQRFPARNKNTETEQEFLNNAESVELVFQVRSEEIAPSDQPTLFETPAFDKGYVRSFMFFAIELKDPDYPRGKYAQFTREVNKRFIMPIVVFFRVENRLTIGFVGRRQHTRDPNLDVLEQVTLIKDIRLDKPHRAHTDILFELSLDECAKWMVAKNQPENFDGLLEAWLARLDTSELNKRFFNELANWYFWAVGQVTFPEDAGEDVEVRNATSVIRLLTRLIFVWFIKEKGLVPDALFNPGDLDRILSNRDPLESTYYKAILQNLFFATLNQEMNTAQKPNNRRFRGERRQHYNITSLYRYKNYFIDPDDALRQFETIPFLNGGLFECLDGPSQEDATRILRVDGFSDRGDIPLHVPNLLFFSEERTVDLNTVYGTRGKRHKVRGLIDILKSYKFTIAENTPIEEEVALDPELLGKVFENLLAAYNPETKKSARKQTGSYYTPREIVNYMTDELLVAYLKNELVARSEAQRSFSMITPPSQLDLTGQADPVQTELGVERASLSDEQKAEIEKKLRELFAYNDEPNPFDGADTKLLIEAIDTLKILDPACGSGAFPMGGLHKLVFILAKLDPGNVQWKDRQIDRASTISDPISRDNAIDDIEAAFERNELNYGRKLYLIENCIYGVDIQPIATQIAKLRFFISLIVDQQIDDLQENRGVRPLPNLETKFVAANTLLGVDKPVQMAIGDTEIDRKEKELEDVRRKHFTARTPRTKGKYRDHDAQIRTEISKLLEERKGFSHDDADRIANWNPYNQNTTVDWFDPEWMFGVRNGFDITIGNPPYVRADSGDEHLAMRQKIEDSNQYETLWEKWDLYVPFIERSYKLLKPGGFTTLIVSDAYCHSKYAQKSQDYFLKNSRILRLDFFSKIKIFDAGVRNITYLFQRADGSHQKPERRVHDPEFGTVTLLPTNEQRELTYRVFFPEDTNAQHFSGPTVKLEGICYITKGMVVHAHERKARGEFELRDLVSDVRDEHHPKPFVEGKHLAKWLPSTNKWLEWGTKRAPDLFSRPTFPELYKHDIKIMLPKVGEIRAALDTNRFYCNEGIFVCLPWHYLSGIINNSIKRSARYRNEKSSKSNLPQRENLEHSSRNFAIKYLLGILNSTPARDFLRANRRNNIQLYPDDWKKVPIPDVSPEQQAPIIELVDQILDAKRTDPNTDVSELENKIDQMVYSLYGLTVDEIDIVKETENV